MVSVASVVGRLLVDAHQNCILSDVELHVKEHYNDAYSDLDFLAKERQDYPLNDLDWLVEARHNCHFSAFGLLMGYYHDNAFDSLVTSRIASLAVISSCCRREEIFKCTFSFIYLEMSRFTFPGFRMNECLFTRLTMLFMLTKL